MVSQKAVEKQLKRIGFNLHGWGRGELSELPNILLPDEEIYECVNGIYEGGFALLLATDVRVLLVDKKPLNFLTVEDLRFDMINEMDYNHRLIGADISISAGSKVLKFRSYNQPRLRKLIGHVQHCMADSKRQQSTHQEGQNQHLQEINQQLQAYLVAQQQYQLQMQQWQQAQLTGQATAPPQPVAAPKPSPELSDYLYAQSILNEYEKQSGTTLPPQSALMQQISEPEPPVRPAPHSATAQPGNAIDLYAEGMKEVFGKHKAALQRTTARHNPLEINPMRIAYSKLPMALRNRKFGRPNFHDHSQATPQPTPAEG